MPNLIKSALVSIFLWMAVAVPATANEIRFQEGYSTSGEAISSNYGSIPGQLTVTLASQGGGSLFFWPGDYSGRPAAYANSTSAIGVVTLTPSAGYSVTLSSFFLGGWPNSNRDIAYSVDNLGTVGIDLGPVNATVPGVGGLIVSPNITSATGIRISFGPDGFNGGINNIVFSVSSVPEPQSIALLLAGLLVVGGAARRRTAKE